MPAARKTRPPAPSVEGQLDDGHYEQLLAAFRQEIAAARAVLKEYQATLRRRTDGAPADDLD